MRISFMAYRHVREGLVWVDEIYTDKGHRGRGVAKWMVWRVAKRQRVELQVKRGDDGREARTAYTGMGMHALRGKERCRTYASVSNPIYEFWATDEYVVTSIGVGQADGGSCLPAWSLVVCGCTLAKKWMGINTRRDPHGSLVTTSLSIYTLMQPYQMKPN